MRDASTCISVGTITEPDCLGPCEPGTSVMLEGIVWQETEGGKCFFKTKKSILILYKINFHGFHFIINIFFLIRCFGS